MTALTPSEWLWFGWIAFIAICLVPFAMLRYRERRRG